MFPSQHSALGISRPERNKLRQSPLRRLASRTIFAKLPQGLRYRPDPIPPSLPLGGGQNLQKPSIPFSFDFRGALTIDLFFDIGHSIGKIGPVGRSETLEKIDLNFPNPAHLLRFEHQPGRHFVPPQSGRSNPLTGKTEKFFARLFGQGGKNFRSPRIIVVNLPPVGVDPRSIFKTLAERRDPVLRQAGLLQNRGKQRSQPRKNLLPAVGHIFRALHAVSTPFRTEGRNRSPRQDHSQGHTSCPNRGNDLSWGHRVFVSRVVPQSCIFALKPSMIFRASSTGASTQTWPILRPGRALALP